jgi:hemoglobin
VRNSSTLYDRIGGHEGILRLIKPFYIDVRQHHLLGPIFNSHIQDWPAHLAHITEFWARQTGGPSRYGGGFAAAHLQLGIAPEHIEQWLALWDFNCRRQLPPDQSAEMSALARSIGTQLRKILSGRSGLSLGNE